MDSIRRREPVVMEKLDLLPAASKWDIEYLRQHMTEWPGLNVLRSAREQNQYMYYVADQPDRDASAHRGAPRRACEDLRMSFAAFLRASREDAARSYYLQAPLAERPPGDAGSARPCCRGLDSALRADCEERSRLELLREEGGLGPLLRSQLFVGPAETLSSAHYDQVDNVYLQVRGSKHFLIFDPAAAEGLCPFPVCHPHDRHARLDLERVDDGAFPRARAALRGRGAAATLGPGDCLYLPTHWWHHVQASAHPTRSGDSDGTWSISLNFWFDITTAVLAPTHPFPPHLELELARHAEILLADTFGGSALSRIAAVLVEDLEGRAGSDAVSLPLRNFLLSSLARLLGPRSVRAFVREHLCPQRFGVDLAAPVRA